MSGTSSLQLSEEMQGPRDKAGRGTNNLKPHEFLLALTKTGAGKRRGEAKKSALNKLVASPIVHRVRYRNRLGTKTRMERSVQRRPRRGMKGITRAGDMPKVVGRTAEPRKKPRGTYGDNAGRRRSVAGHRRSLESGRLWASSPVLSLL